MSDVQALVVKKDGMTLKSMAEEGNHEAGLAFAELVFDAKYVGDEAAIKAKTVTKKDEKDKARKDAFAFLEAGAESGYLPAIIRKAETKFRGIREPGPHGSQLTGAFYSEAEELYRDLLENPECPEDRRGEFLIHQAQAIDFKSRYKGIDRSSEVLDLLHQALKEKDSQNLAHYILSGIYWKEGEHRKALEHAYACFKEYPFAALILQKAHEKGLGVEPDADQASKYYQFWFEQTGPKKRSK